MNVQIVIKNFKFKDDIFFVIICILYLFTLKDFIIIADEVSDIENWNIGYISENKKQAIAGLGKGEYLPSKANENREYILERKDEVYILSGDAEITEFNKNGQTLNLKINITENETILEFPYIYYPGYIITVDGEEIQGFESENGFLAISINKDEGDKIISVEYKGTFLMLISKIISFFGVIRLCYLCSKN